MNLLITHFSAVLSYSHHIPIKPVFSNTLNLCVFLLQKDKFHTNTKQQIKYYLLRFNPHLFIAQQIVRHARLIKLPIAMESGSSSSLIAKPIRQAVSLMIVFSPILVNPFTYGLYLARFLCFVNTAAFVLLPFSCVFPLFFKPLDGLQCNFVYLTSLFPRSLEWRMLWPFMKDVARSGRIQHFLH